MPILLDIPFNPGDNDPGVTYTHVAIVRFAAFLNEPSFLEVYTTYGTVDEDGVFIPAANARTDKIIIADNDKLDTTDFTTLKNAMPIPGLPTYHSVGAQLYQYLIQKGKYAGTIV